MQQKASRDDEELAAVAAAASFLAAMQKSKNAAAVALNAIGASLLSVHKDFRGSIETLRDTVELLSGQHDASSVEFEAFAASALARAESRLRRAAATSESATSTSRSTESGKKRNAQFEVCGNGGALLVQNEPLTLSSQSVDEPPARNKPPTPCCCFDREEPQLRHYQQKQNSEEISAAVLHNLALSFHLLACSSEYDAAAPSRRDTLLDRSLALYELSMEIVLRIERDRLNHYGSYYIANGASISSSSVIEGGGLPRLVRSYLNNAGQILVEHKAGERDRGKRHFRDLEALIRSAVVSNDGTNDDDSSCSKIYAFNVLVVGQLNAAKMA